MVPPNLTIPRSSRCELEESEKTLPNSRPGRWRKPAMGLVRQYTTCLQNRLDTLEALCESQRSGKDTVPTRARVYSANDR